MLIIRKRCTGKCWMETSHEYVGESDFHNITFHVWKCQRCSRILLERKDE